MCTYLYTVPVYYVCADSVSEKAYALSEIFTSHKRRCCLAKKIVRLPPFIFTSSPFSQVYFFKFRQFLFSSNLLNDILQDIDGDECYSLILLY
jgi:hypothetical protein